MKTPNKLLTIIQEELEIIEAQINPHANFRIDGRLNKMVYHQFLTESESITTATNLATVVGLDFPEDRSYGIRLSRFHINPKARQIEKQLEISTDKGKKYYRIYQEDDDDIVKDSTGNEFWAVVRENELKTVFLRKDYQRAFAHLERNDKGGLGVTDVIDDINTYISNGYKTDAELKKETEIQQQQDREKVSLEKAVAIKRIDGVNWEVDVVNKNIHKKNKPTDFITFDDFYAGKSGWGEEIDYEILDIIDKLTNK